MRSISQKIALLLAINIFATFCGCSKKHDEANEELYISTETITPNGYIYSNDGVETLYLDFTSLETCPYCSIVNCIHNDSTCQARMFQGTEHGPIPYDNCIYYFSDSDETWVDKDKDGREETEIINESLICYNLENNKTETVASWTGTEACCYNGACIMNHTLYFIGIRGYTEFTELPGLETPENIPMECQLYSYDMNKKKLKKYGSLYDDDLQYSGAASTRSLIMRGVSGKSIYFMYSYLEDDSQENTMENETHICLKLDTKTDEITIESEAAPEQICEGYRCHSDGDKAVIINDDRTWEFPAIKNGFLTHQLTVANDRVWYINEEQSWYYDLRKEKKINISVNAPSDESACVIYADEDSFILKYLDNEKYCFKKFNYRGTLLGESLN